MECNSPDKAFQRTAWQCNPNLLDNWYFVGGGSQKGSGIFPINQRGDTSYLQIGYGIDRWKLSGSNFAVTIGSDCITITDSNTGSYQLLAQYLENPTQYAGKQLTASALVRTQKDTRCKLGMRDNTANQWTTANEVPVKQGDWNLISATAIPKSSLTYAFFQPWEHNVPFDVLAMKLEYGPNQTLAHKEGGKWVLNEIPSFSEQLLRCQRYFQTFRTVTLRQTEAEDFRPVMRARPTPGTITVKDNQDPPQDITLYTADANI